ncbi:ABC transporter ATP-binding protein [Anaerosacchariphilus sp. NSJ-68]|uniref:ABC transporter ATP-binding protein n=2 Tax=Lachnospiraceae TaxID=186803 RepID=A0A923LEW4_9FIRM|nr:MULTISPECIES: ABC transporter ATP-binding protein [Lachnospiraceae]MBC5661002.1 ABC transporter ATP-binding protein [Anaerosacchariphilus hominis]MBC5699659.1 ABC transporter ATP-binding protein [Roseburia difficilis]
MSHLKIEQLKVNYGGIQALKGVDLEVREGEIITLVGANGAGKSTLMNTLMGLVRPARGHIYLDGEEITGLDTKKIVQKGMVLSPEGRQVFPEFSVKDNLMMGAYLRKEKDAAKELDTVLQMFPILKERFSQTAGTLSGGEQQMLAVGRAMMADPKILLLDEPSLGLAPLVIKEIFQMIQRIRNMGVTVLLVEQNARMSLKISDRAYVLETGLIVASDTAERILNSEEIQKAYLGGL